jgi:hypothetical protein
MYQGNCSSLISKIKSPELLINVGGQVIIGLNASSSLFEYDADREECFFKFFVRYDNSTENPELADVDQMLILNSQQFFANNNGIFIDFEKKLQYFTGPQIYNIESPVPKPIDPDGKKKGGLPVWAIILMIVGVLGIGVAVWQYCKNKNLKSGLNTYHNI